MGMPADEEETDALIAIGSNVAPEANVPSALVLLRNICPIVSVSNFYWSEPLGPAGQPRFLNGACRIRTRIPARTLKFDVLRGIEAELGRLRTEDRYAPREVDFDIALYGNTIANEAGLQIPDPDIRLRPFLAIPLAEIAPDWVVPGIGAMLRDIAAGLPESELTLALGVTEACRRIVFEEHVR